jgi:hypothetical protein
VCRAEITRAAHAPGADEFTPQPPLPERTDGRFEDPKVHVLGYESIGIGK